MFFPTLKPADLRRVTMDVFPGLDRRESAEPGGLREMENLSSDGYPTLSTRPLRGLMQTLQAPNGLLCKDCLYWVDGTQLYANGLAVGPTLTSGEKQLVSMGAYLIIFPDGVYINTQNTAEYGTLACTRTVSAGASITLCRADGTAYTGTVESTTAPEDPAEGALWMDVSESVPVLRQYSQQVWTALADVCVKVSATGIGTGFAAGDGVTVSGCDTARLNGLTVLEGAGADWVIFPGIVPHTVTQSAAITVKREVPAMDFIVQSGNRLWGCKYGMVDGAPVNEIYASKLGDFKNWNCFAGLSTDSYAAQRGSDGAFTGAVSFLGNPIFFKERCMERVYASGQGAHQIVTTECAGVQSGSHKSLQVVGGVLYYLASDGVQAFDGSLPVTVSAALGEAKYHAGVGGAWQEKYYLSALDSTQQPSLFVYDSGRKLWHREDSLRGTCFASDESDLYCLASNGQLWSLHAASGTPESSLSWTAESGDLGMQLPARKRLMQLLLYVQAGSGASVTASVSYNRGATWQAQGTVYGNGSIREQVLAIRPKQCRRLRLRLSGQGACRLYALTAVYEKGSDGL